MLLVTVVRCSRMHKHIVCFYMEKINNLAILRYKLSKNLQIFTEKMFIEAESIVYVKDNIKSEGIPRDY